MAKSKATIVSARELAAALGLAEKTITNLATEGVVVRLGRGSFDKWKSVARYLDHLRQAVEQRKPTATTEQRARLVELRADALECANIAACSELVLAADVRAEWAGLTRDMRAMARTIVDRIRTALPSLDDAAIAMIQSELEITVASMDPANTPGLKSRGTRG